MEDRGGTARDRFDTAQTVTGDEASLPRAFLESPGLMAVEVVGGPMDGHTASVNREVLTIGRAEVNDLCLGLDGRISSRHARIVRQDDHYYLEDTGSRNGTYVGDKRIEGRTLIGPGMIFVVGHTYLEFNPR